MREIVVGLDLGHSAVKMTFDGRNGVDRRIYPALACPAIPIRNEAEARQAALDTVHVHGRAFFVGETAALQGNMALSSGLSADWISTDEHTALMAMGRQIVDRDGIEGPRIYVLGLPISRFEDDRDKLRQIASHILTDAVEIKIVPQPMGGYNAHMLSRAGVPQSGRSMKDESWAIVDVGYYSTDFIMFLGGRWIEPASGGCAGVRMAAEHLQRALSENHKVERNLVDVEQALRQGYLKHRGLTIRLEQEIQYASTLVANKVSDMAAQLMENYIDKIDGILVIGGGAGMVLPTLQQRWSHAVEIVDQHHNPALSGPRYLVSEGYYRFGKSIAWMREKRQQHQG